MLVALLLMAVFVPACATVSQAGIDLHRLDVAIGIRNLHLAEKLSGDIDHEHLTLHQRCLLKLYTVRYFRLSKKTDKELATLRQLRRHCTEEPGIFAWGLFELGLYTTDKPVLAIKVFARVLALYPDQAAAHPALFELLSAAKKAGIDPTGTLKKVYIRHPKAEMAAEVLDNLAALSKGKERRAILMRLAMQFPNHPLGAKARLVLVRDLEPRDPVGALEVLYKLAYGTETSLLIGSYATGVEGPALLEAARVWDRYMDNPVRAERDYRRFIKAFPDSSQRDDALYDVYQMYERRGQKQKADKVLKELATRFPDGARGMQAKAMLKEGEK